MDILIRKVRSMMSRKGERKLIPAITVAGIWLESLGFYVDSKISVEANTGELIIRLVKGEQQETAPKDT